MGEAVSRAAELIKQRTGRDCGSCSLCCKLLSITAPELNKPPNVWCAHCRPGKGCSIYSARPEICQEFACGWLFDSALGDEWKPTRAKIVINYEVNKSTGLIDCNFVVDPAVPGRWREAPYHAVIRQTAFNGLNAIGGRRFATYVKIREQTLIVLPRKEVDVTDRAHLALCTGGEEEWEALRFNSEDEAHRVVDAMEKMRAMAQAMSPGERAKMRAELQHRMREEVNGKTIAR